MINYFRKILEAIKFLNVMENQDQKIMITFHRRKIHFYKLEEITDSITGTVEAKGKEISLWGKIKL